MRYSVLLKLLQKYGFDMAFLKRCGGLGEDLGQKRGDGCAHGFVVTGGQG